MIKESQISTNCYSPHLAQMEKLRHRESRGHVQIQTNVEGKAKGLAQNSPLEKNDLWFLSFLLVPLGIP